jgi:hypothetical protein
MSILSCKILQSGKLAILSFLSLCFFISSPAQEPTTGSPPEPSFADLNNVAGLNLWEDDNLWDDADGAVASRLGWRQESQTATDASYRQYPGADAVVLGVRPYSLALYGSEGTVSQVSMVFANKGDFAGLYEDPARSEENAQKRKQRENKVSAAEKAFGPALEKDALTVESALEKLLGAPRRQTIGVGQSMRERVSRWDWKGHAILLSSQEEEYLRVAIMSTADADLGGRPARISDAQLRERLKARVERRPNGDVIVTQIPMVNQGPKGFCVPATWERYLRYLGIPSDMYVLAMAGGTKFGGGTNCEAIADAVSGLASRAGRSVTMSGSSLEVRNVAKEIDDGLPLMWAMLVNRQFDDVISDRTKARERRVTDAATAKVWSEEVLKPARKEAKSIQTSRQNGHVRMIIGYNKLTDELAMSDSWGPEYAERWITVDEATEISQGDIRLIRP